MLIEISCIEELIANWKRKFLQEVEMSKKIFTTLLGFP